MRILFLGFLLISQIVYGQDTTLIRQSGYGNFGYQIITKTDTSEIGYYSPGKTEYTIHRDKQSKKLLYTRYYRNGKKMWIKEWKQDTENGKCTYFDTKGNRVAEFNYVGGAIRDTLFLEPNTYFLFGKLSYTSTVYGGMEREDGSSNVSSSSGPYSYYHMKFIQLDPPKGKAAEEFYFTSDFQGEFLVVIKPGKYGLFQKDFSPKDVEPDMFSPQNKPGGSTIDHWDIRSPIVISKGSLINSWGFHYESVGYAP